MQRSAIGHGAASSEVHVRHVYRHCTVLYLVRQRHFLGCVTAKSHNSPLPTVLILHLLRYVLEKKWKGLAFGMAGRWMHRVLAFSIRIMLDP